MLTPEQKAAYIDDDDHCPYCESTDITGDSDTNLLDTDYEHGKIWRKVHCHACKKNWWDGYSLTDIYEEEEEN